MNSKLNNLLDKLQFGEVQNFKNLTIMPFYYKNGNKLEYISLEKALENDKISIKEINEDGSVPELFVANDSDVKVLLLDGEELIGAKQNRVINATILLDVKTSTKIPVSCVEAGRWKYRNGKYFNSAKRTMPSSMRFSKNISVTKELKKSEGKSYRSNQSEVWMGVSRLSTDNKFKSPTGAMSDVYDYKKEDIDEYIKSFTLKENQNGMIIFINNNFAGVEYISYQNCFTELYNKLLKGYIMDALTCKKNNDNQDFELMRNELFDKIKKEKIDTFKSVGMGEDNRIQTDSFIASFLYVEDEIVHFNALKEIKISLENLNFDAWKESNRQSELEYSGIPIVYRR